MKVLLEAIKALLRDLGCDPAPPRGPAPGDQLSPEIYVATSGQRITGFLDTSQTSLVCIDNTKSRISEAAIASGAHFGLSNDRAWNLAFGHGELDDSARLEFKAKYLRNFTEAARALRLLAEYRNRQEPLLGDASSGFEALYRATSNSELMQEFRDAGVLPATVQDWDAIRCSPELESPLRRFYVEWMGCLDPVFRLTVESGSVRSKVINGVTYAAYPHKKRIKPTLEGAVAIPRYRLLIETGFHAEPFNPPLEIPKDGSKTFDLAIELIRPTVGVTYDLQLSFNCTDHTNFTLPPFAITFFRDCPESLSRKW